MATPTPIKGNSGFYITLKKGVGAAVNFTEDIKAFELSGKDKDDSNLTFAEAAAGLSQFYELKLTALASFDAASLWQFAWSNPGATVSVVLAPLGNTTASVAQPHLKFDATLPGKPGLSNAAGTAAKPKYATYDLVLTSITEPTQVTA